jgi:hypothetical protein
VTVHQNPTVYPTCGLGESREHVMFSEAPVVPAVITRQFATSHTNSDPPLVSGHAHSPQSRTDDSIPAGESSPESRHAPAPPLPQPFCSSPSSCHRHAGVPAPPSPARAATVHAPIRLRLPILASPRTPPSPPRASARRRATQRHRRHVQSVKCESRV